MNDMEDTEQPKKIRKKRTVIVPEPEPYFEKYLDVNKRLYKLEALLLKLRISRLSFMALAEQKRFPIGRLGIKYFVPKEPFLKYLDSVHLEKKTNETDPSACYLKGNISENLTLVKIPLTDVPDLKPTSEYAKRICMSQKTILSRCISGEIPWFRIGEAVRISEDDWAKALYETTETTVKKRPRGKNKKTFAQIEDSHME